MNLTTAVARSAFCLAVARINLPHIQMEKADGLDTEAFEKLLSKQTAFLRGELKSRDNLARFYEAFEVWRDARPEDDSLAWRISELSCAALYASIESLFDEECDDTALILNNIGDLYDEMDALGADTSGLRGYWADICQEFEAEFAEVRQLPLAKRYFQWLSEMDVSLFGVSND